MLFVFQGSSQATDVPFLLVRQHTYAFAFNIHFFFFFNASLLMYIFFLIVSSSFNILVNASNPAARTLACGLASVFIRSLSDN